MAWVCLGEDLRQGRAVALKLLRPELVPDRVWVERFEAEAGILGRLNHPNIIRLHDFFRDGAQFGMVLEYAPGATFADLLLRHREGLDWRESLGLIGPVLAALDHAHRRDIVHRDIKPANLVRTADGSVKLMDFGIARVQGAAGLTRTGFMAGTLAYMAPEQIQAQPQDGRSDLYSAAMLLYAMLCGRPAFDEPTEYRLIRAQVEAPPPPLRRWRPDIPVRLERLVLQALNKEPEARFGSAGEFRRALEEVLRERPGKPADSRAGLDAPREVPRHGREPTVVLPARLPLVKFAEKPL
jgi:serine/threonine protein kinase